MSLSLKLKCLGAALATFVSARANASQVLAMDLSQITSESDRVVLAEVLDVKSAWNDKHTTIVSRVELAVSETWKGEVPTTRRISVLQIGGDVDGVEMRVHGLSLFARGERAVLFLRGPVTAAAVVGMGQGKRPLRYDSTHRKWMALAGDRSAAVVRGPDGQLQKASPDDDLPVDELRDRVRALTTAATKR